MADETRFDQKKVAEEIRTSFGKLQPDLDRDFIRACPRTTPLRGDFPRGLSGILFEPPLGTNPGTEEALQILTELHRLLALEGLRGLPVQRTMLTFLLLAFILRRPQLCDTDGLKQYSTLNTNFSVYKSRLSEYLGSCYEEPQDIRISFGTGRHSYLPIITHRGEVPPPIELSPVPSHRDRHFFNRHAYSHYLAKAIAQGRTIEVYLRGEEPLFERPLIDKALQAINHRPRFAVIPRGLRVDGAATNSIEELTVIDDRQILVAFENGPNAQLTECLAGDPDYEFFRSYIAAEEFPQDRPDDLQEILRHG